MRAALGTLFTLLGLAGLGAALLRPDFRSLGVGVGVVFFFLAGTVLSNANRLADPLRLLVKKPVRVEVWGMPLSPSTGAAFEIDSVRVFGAALLLHLRPIPGGARTLLKVAQPGPARRDDGRIAIDDAAYISWGGTKLQPAVGERAPALMLELRPEAALLIS